MSRNPENLCSLGHECKCQSSNGGFRHGFVPCIMSPGSGIRAVRVFDIEGLFPFEKSNPEA